MKANRRLDSSNKNNLQLGSGLALSVVGHRSGVQRDQNLWSSVADPEGVHWVPWNPSFEELPSKILCANILRTRRSHWSYALQLHNSNNPRVSAQNIKNSTCAWPMFRVKRASELQQRFYSCNTPSAAKDGNMLSA